jgi:transposase
MFIMVVMEQQRRPRRSFPDEYKAQVVELCRGGERSVGAVAKDLDLSETAVRRWISQAEIDSGHRAGLTTAEREELARLRKENRILREERDLLKRAASFFARETR